MNLQPSNNPCKYMNQYNCLKTAVTVSHQIQTVQPFTSSSPEDLPEQRPRFALATVEHKPPRRLTHRERHADDHNAGQYEEAKHESPAFEHVLEGQVEQVGEEDEEDDRGLYEYCGEASDGGYGRLRNQIRANDFYAEPKDLGIFRCA